MGQYYRAIIIDKDGKILGWICPRKISCSSGGAELLEHSYLGSRFVSAFEFTLSPQGSFHKSRVVWAGDYADCEVGHDSNLYSQCPDHLHIAAQGEDTSVYRFIVNHTKRHYVDKNKVKVFVNCYGDIVHPLPLLTAEGNGRGGGDFRGESPLIGLWARDVISIEESTPDGFEELLFDLVES
jgi:hypothetical protein